MPGDVQLWAGPAIIAALVTGLLTLWRDWRNERRGDRETQRAQAERKARQRDTAAALLAEVDAFRQNFDAEELRKNREWITERYRADPTFNPVLMRQSFDYVYRSHVRDLGVIASDALVPVVAFYGQLDRVGHVIEDLRSDRVAGVSVDRRVEIYSDYIAMLLHALNLAEIAHEALSRFTRDV